MKRALCATTALVAAGLVAGQASAASGLKLGITGFYRGAIGVEFGDSNQVIGPVGTGDWGRNNVAFRQEVRVNFTGETTLDNGLTFDVLIGLNAGGANSSKSNAPARINRAYMDVGGKFGQVRFGDANSAYQSMCVGDPGNVTANFGLNSPNESFSNAGRFAPSVPTPGPFAGATVFMPTAVSGAGTCFGLETRSTKIMYFSPTFGGFNFAVSYAPSHIRGAGGSGGTGGTVGLAGLHNFLSVGANFTHDFGGVTLTAGASGEWALSGKTGSTDHAANSPNRPAIYQGGVQIAFGAFAVGASGQYVSNFVNAGYGNAIGFATTTDDAYMITAGGSWTMDAVSVGLQGLYNHYNLDGPFTSPGGSTARYYGVSLNGSYALGAGISLEGQVAWTRSANNLPVGIAHFGNVNSYEFDFGTAINF
jgi:outer membrane protein OmpU